MRELGDGLDVAAPVVSTDWAEVDHLIRGLSDVCAASDAATASALAKRAMAQAVREAARAVSKTVDHPGDEATMGRALQAIRVAEQVIWALDAETARFRKLRAEAGELCPRARDLINEAAPTP